MFRTILISTQVRSVLATSSRPSLKSLRTSRIIRDRSKIIMAGKRKAVFIQRAGDVSPPPLKKTIMSSTTKSSVQSFFTPTSQKIPEPITWKVADKSLICGIFTPQITVANSISSTTIQTTSMSTKSSPTKITTSTSEEVTSTSTISRLPSNATKNDGTSHAPTKIKIAAFDLDSTLIKTLSGNKFAKDANDWKWWDVCVPGRMKRLSDEGFRIVIFSNQNGIKLVTAKSEKRFTDWKSKISVICKQLDVSMNIYAATEKDQYRKPRTGMFEHFLEDLGDDAIRFDLSNSIYVGDAAGRPNDHSAGDRLLAENIGMPFKTPEEFFRDESPEKFSIALDLNKFDDSSVVELPSIFTKEHPLELVIFVGSPAAGKSTFYKEFLQAQDYERVNQDTLKTRDKCIKVARDLLRAGQSVAVDNTNPDRDVRALWKKLAEDEKAILRCLHFTTPPEICEHNDGVRAFGKLKSLNPENRTRLPTIAFGGFKTRYQEPTLAEGFCDITKVDFKFRGSDSERQVWFKHY